MEDQYDCDEGASFFFPGYSNETAHLLCTAFVKYQSFVYQAFFYQVYICLLCWLLNTFHILILTRKSMRTSATNILLTAVAICDCYSLISVVYDGVLQYYYTSLTTSFPTSTYLETVISIIHSEILIFMRRSSTWLLFSMAVIRLLVIRNPLQPKYRQLSRAKFGGYCILIVSLGSGLLMSPGPFKYQIVSYEMMIGNVTVWKHTPFRSALFNMHDMALFRINAIMETMSSYLIPCVLFPIVTILLVNAIRKSAGSRIASKSKEDSRRTTKLVFYQTITFFISEFPVGILLAGQALRGLTWIQWFLRVSLDLFGVIKSLNTASHMVFCLLISSQYRGVAKSLIFCGSTHSRIVTVVHSQITTK